MEINSEALSRFWWVLIEESRGAPNLLANLRLAASITLNGCGAFNAHPPRAVDEVFECLGARVAESLMPRVLALFEASYGCRC